MFEKLTEHIYLYPCDGYTDRPNIGLILGEKYSLLFEGGNSAAHVALMREDLARQGLPEPDFVAVSHWHWDHTFGMHAWNVPTIAGQKTNEQLREVSRWKWDDRSMDERVEKKQDIVFCNEMIRREYPDRSQILVEAADIVFEDRMSIDLGGGVVCELIHAKGPHSEDSVICYVPSEKFVFLGDSNGKDLYGKPWHFDLEHEDEMVQTLQTIPYDWDLVEEYVSLLNTLEFTDCIGGHAGPMSRAELYRSLAFEKADDLM